MLEIVVPENELFDEGTQTFISIKEQTLRLEHSLVSLSKWESKWHKPFLSNQDKTFEETIDYVRCMTLTQNVHPDTYKGLTNENIQQINDYISNPMTATTFADNGFGSKMRQQDTLTNEVIYWLMSQYNLDPEVYQKWHLNRLLTLLRVCDIKSSPAKKMSRRDVMRRYADENERRRKLLNSKG